MLSIKGVKHISKLANLPLSDEEVGKFTKQLDETLDYVKILGEVDTSKEAVTSQVTGTKNVFMLDDSGKKVTLGQDEVLSNAKRRKRNLFETEAVAWE